jgi:HEAT repeat protein
MMKRAIRVALTTTIALALAVGASAQDKTSKSSSTQSQGGEKTVEEAYLQESAEAMMVKELSRSDDKEGKLLALDYARKSLDAGRKNDDVRSALQYLALENTEVVIRSAGLGVATNNFPDVRMKACEYLGEFPSVESKDTLIKVILNSKIEDPMVLAEAIHSLGKIGMNDNDEVVDAIARSVDHFANVGMSEDRLAVYTMFAFTDLAEKNHGIKDMATVTNTIMKFTKGIYVSAVKKLAMQTLEKLSQYQAKGGSSK